MASFITTPSIVLSFRNNTTSATCSLTRNIFPHASSRSNPTMQTTNFSPNDEIDDEDDSPIMGTGAGLGPGYGMQAPPLTPSDRIYLDGAKNNKEYMTRMTEIARRLEHNKQIRNTTNPIQTPDQYVESLSRENQPPAEGDYTPRVDPADEYLDNLGKLYRKKKGIQDPRTPADLRATTHSAGPGVDPTLVAKPNDSFAEVEDKMRAIEEEIEQVSQGLKQSEESVAQEVMDKLNEMAHIREIETVVEDVEEVLDMTLEEGARQIADLQRQIREAAGAEEVSESEALQINNEIESQPDLEQDPQFEPEPDFEASLPTESLRRSHIGKEPGTIDKQIDFLESYLFKLQKEAAEDPEARAEQSVPQEPKHDVSEEVQTTMSTVAEQIGKMPSERVSFEGLQGTPGEMSAEEKMAIFEQLRRRAASAQPSTEFTDPFNVRLPERGNVGDVDDGDEPSPESEAEYDSFESSFGNKNLLIEEIETEVKAYSRDVKALLQKHETRLQVLLTRLRAL